MAACQRATHCSTTNETDAISDDQPNGDNLLTQCVCVCPRLVDEPLINLLLCTRAYLCVILFAHATVIDINGIPPSPTDEAFTRDDNNLTLFM